MKKIMMFLICISLMSGCTSAKEKSVVCKMNAKAGLEVTTQYFYNEDNTITKMKEVNVLTLSDEDLVSYGFDEYEKEIKSLYADKKNAKGVNVAFKSDEGKKQIIVEVSIDFSKYDFVLDVFSLGEEANFSDIHTYIDTINAFHISTCEEVK